MPPRGSPSKGPSKVTSDPTALSLPALLKLLTTAGPKPPHLSMSQAMQAAAKLVPAGCTSHAKLRTLTQVEMARIGIADEDVRKGVMAVIGKGGAAGAKGKGKAAQGQQEQETKGYGGEFGEQAPRKRSRESDLDRPLPTRAPREVTVDEDFAFDEIEAEEGLAQKVCIVNRAPVMTAWACIVAERLGFRRQEALSIAHVFTDLNATSKGVSLGIMSSDALKVDVGPSQPFVEILGRRVPVLSTQHGEWRAISKGHVADPSKAFAYMRGAFRQQLGAVIGSMRLLADSFSPKELNDKGYALYLDFRPEVDGWGKKGELRMSTILDLRRFLTHKSEPAPDGEAGEQAKADAETAADERVVKQEVQGGGGEEEVVRVKPEPDDEENLLTPGTGAGQDAPPAAKKVKREEETEDAKPQVDRVPAEEANEFDALLEDDDELFASIDL
ncbi:uncharacterized protein JCM10292_006051 [Rhodotorula paludigena]|uniref:uncharacterized protein n=1 Tax=Rhodotorula paludigena TaxID=86838 RepID=UPI0031744C43